MAHPAFLPAVKPLAALLFGSLAWTACSVASPGAAGSDPGGAGRTEVVGRNFTLRPGEVATLGDLRVGLEAVTSDSRCPKGERCITAGDAAVRVWLQHGGAPRVIRELRLVAAGAQTASAHTAGGPGHEVQLLALEPYPVSARPIAAADYAATLVVRRSTAAASKPAGAGTAER